MQVCPECGEDRFITTQIRVYMVKFETSVYGRVEVDDDQYPELISVDDAQDDFECTECGEHFYSEEDLITQDEYNERQDDDDASA